MTTRAEIEAKRREALRLHAAGVSKLAIGIQLGVSRKTVFNWLPPSHPRAERKVTRAELEALRCQQFTNIEIARQSGISRQRVAQILGPIPRPHREMKKGLRSHPRCRGNPGRSKESRLPRRKRAVQRRRQHQRSWPQSPTERSGSSRADPGRPRARPPGQIRRVGTLPRFATLPCLATLVRQRTTLSVIWPTSAVWH